MPTRAALARRPAAGPSPSLPCAGRARAPAAPAPPPRRGAERAPRPLIGRRSRRSPFRRGNAGLIEAPAPRGEPDRAGNRPLAGIERCLDAVRSWIKRRFAGRMRGRGLPWDRRCACCTVKVHDAVHLHHRRRGLLTRQGSVLGGARARCCRRAASRSACASSTPTSMSIRAR